MRMGVAVRLAEEVVEGVAVAKGRVEVEVDVRARVARVLQGPLLLRGVAVGRAGDG